MQNTYAFTFLKLYQKKKKPTTFHNIQTAAIASFALCHWVTTTSHREMAWLYFYSHLC